MFTRVSTITILFIYLILGPISLFIKFNLLGLIFVIGIFSILQSDNLLLYIYLVISKKEHLSFEKYILYTGNYVKTILPRDVYLSVNFIFSSGIILGLALAYSSGQYTHYLTDSVFISAICVYGILIQAIKLIYIFTGKTQQNNLL